MDDGAEAGRPGSLAAACCASWARPSALPAACCTPGSPWDVPWDPACSWGHTAPSWCAVVPSPSCTAWRPRPRGSATGMVVVPLACAQEVVSLVVAASARALALGLTAEAASALRGVSVAAAQSDADVPSPVPEVEPRAVRVPSRVCRAAVVWSDPVVEGWYALVLSSRVPVLWTWEEACLVGVEWSDLEGVASYGLVLVASALREVAAVGASVAPVVSPC